MFEGRVHLLKKGLPSKEGKYVLYMMEASIRASFNFALEYAIKEANLLSKPLVVAFSLTDVYPFSNQRYYRFLIESLLDVRNKLRQRGISFYIIRGKYTDVVSKLLPHACMVVLDRNYLKAQRNWRKQIASMAEQPVVEIESDVVYPIELVANKKVPYAYLYRQKVAKLPPLYRIAFDYYDLAIKTSVDIPSWDLDTPADYLRELKIDKTISTVEQFFVGGETVAQKLLKIFKESSFHHYHDKRSDPSLEMQSNLSPYLHFGNISPLDILQQLRDLAGEDDPNWKSFFNEVVIWRELARNYVWYNSNYHDFNGLPNWSKDTLLLHMNDKRPYNYSLDELEHAKTHDNFWNAAQLELLKTGKMHNYMRMYWAKKIIEWTTSPQIAFDICCYLNDKYELDGRDPNGYASIAWCFGAFDKPWPERAIFGKIRYMSEKSLARKFDMNSYVRKINLL
ncbi:MAG: deoxyribodipyrimidine photo-lyase [Bacteroidales bacterium]|nr:deoxyribodipyrimidine photo-lyase [Bacteroidales bacterium]